MGEMARTGLPTQRFRLGPAVEGGPAFLVYYGPALLQRCRHQESGEMHLALLALAEVLKAGRQLWPVDRAGQGKSVTLEIGKLKSIDVNTLDTGGPGDNGRAIWALVAKNDKEGVVELLSGERVNALNATGGRYCALDFSRRPAAENDIDEEEEENSLEVRCTRQMSNFSV